MRDSSFPLMPYPGYEAHVGMTLRTDGREFQLEITEI